MGCVEPCREHAVIMVVGVGAKDRLLDIIAHRSFPTDQTLKDPIAKRLIDGPSYAQAFRH
jgi:hypothetical protein